MSRDSDCGLCALRYTDAIRFVSRTPVFRLAFLAAIKATLAPRAFLEFDLLFATADTLGFYHLQ
jgi:hypothetical protein